MKLTNKIYTKLINYKIIIRHRPINNLVNSRLLMFCDEAQSAPTMTHPTAKENGQLQA